MVEPLATVKDLRVRFLMARGSVDAVRGVDLTIAPGEIVGIVGESGSGKSAFAKAFVKLHQPPFTPRRTVVRGSIQLGTDELVGAPARTMRRVRARNVAVVPQDALSGLNPVVPIGRQVAEAARAGGGVADVPTLLADVGLRNASQRVGAFPHQLSGGERQRVIIAMALARAPQLLIADEPTTALDVTVQAQILGLIEALRARHGTAVLFITHDLDVVAAIADRTAVFYAGEIVEIAQTEALFCAPAHPYTRALLASRPGEPRQGRLTGAAPAPGAIPSGCAFAPRCALADAACAEPPPVLATATGHVRCWRAAA